MIKHKDIGQTVSNQTAGQLYICQKYIENTMTFAVGDRLTVVTDGILEWLSGPNLGAQEEQLAKAAAAPTDQFWSTLGVAPKSGGIDDVTCFSLELHS